MKLKIYKVLLLILCIGMLGSCKKKFLELTPPTSLTPGQALGTEADLLVALRGAYAGMRAVDFLGRTIPLLGDNLADNTYQHGINTNRYTVFNNYTYNTTDGNVTGMWRGGYTVILRANNIINAKVASTPNADQYRGEAYAIRALAYFELIRFFARPFTDAPTGMGIPIVTSYNPDATIPRSSTTEVYNLIISDLNQAFSLMTKYTNSSQFSKYAAKALLAKVYLAMGDKANAKAAALDVINNGGFTSLTAANHAAYWANSTVRTDKLETIFEISSDAVGNNAFDNLSYIYTQGGNYGDFVVADDFYAMFTATDVRKALYPMTPRPKPAGPSIPAVEKYPVISGDVSDTKVIRLSEMYLIAAEASLPTNEADALTYINYITSRRNATPIASTGAQLLTDVLNERRRELAFEGERYHDLNRLKLDVTRGTNFPASARTIPYSNYRRIMPIPQAELDANPTIRTQQNPGY